MKKYKTINVDPPWEYGKWGKGSQKAKYSEMDFNIDAEIPYKTMTIQEIKDLPISSIADDNCELYLWTTQKYLPYSFSIIEYWGFKYCQTLTWCKKPMGKGQGGVYTPTTEFIILGRKGRMPKVKRIDTTWWQWSRAWKTHSKKPESFQSMIETVTEPPRIELFARRRRPGWDVWGNEVKSDINLVIDDCEYTENLQTEELKEKKINGFGL